MNVFNKDANKAMLWSLLDKQGKFNTIPVSFNINELFEKNIKNTQQQCSGNEKLVNINKAFIAAILQDLSIFTAPSLIKKNKTETFNNNLQEKEQSFKDMMKVPAPTTVDFSDKNGDGPIQNIDDLLSKQLEKRNLDTSTFNNNVDETSVKEWLTGESSSLPPQAPKNKEAHIKIGELVAENVIVTPIKTVRFSSDETVMPDIAEPTSIVTATAVIADDDDVRTAVMKILKNQEYIINAIHDLQDRI